jgi:hypothetical protein
MKKIVLLAFFLFLCSARVTKAQFVQVCPATNNNASGTSISCTFSSPVGAHHALVLGSLYGSVTPTITSATDTLGLTFTVLNSRYTNSGGSGLSTGIVYICDTGSGGTDTVTINYSGATQFRYIVGLEISGRATSACVDGGSDNKAQTITGSTTMTSGSRTTTAASDFLVGFFGSQGGCTGWTAQSDGSGHNYTIPTNGSNIGVAIEYLTENSIGTYNASVTCNASTPWNAHMIAFLPSGGAPPGPAPPLAINVAPNCTSSVTCTYTDVAVPAGQHFYFAIAVNMQSLQSVGSNTFNVTVPSGLPNVVLSWTPSASGPSGISYTIYRGAPPTGVTIGD